MYMLYKHPTTTPAGWIIEPCSATPSGIFKDFFWIFLSFEWIFQGSSFFSLASFNNDSYHKLNYVTVAYYKPIHVLYVVMCCSSRNVADCLNDLP